MSTLKYVILFSVLLVFCMIPVSAIPTVTEIWDFSDPDRFPDAWEITISGTDHNEIIQENNNDIYSVSGLCQAIYTDTGIKDPYEISYKIKMGRTAAQLNNGVFVRGTYPEERNGKTLHFFEDAKTAAAAGDHIAGSGLSIVIKMIEEKPVMRLTFKTYDENTEYYVGNAHVDIFLPENTVLTEFHGINIKDGGSEIVIKFNETIMATVIMGNKGVYGNDMDYKDTEYYKSAKVKDASGNEILNIANARLAYESVIAFVSRNLRTEQGVSYSLDDIALKIDYPDATATPESEQTPTAEKTGLPSPTPETSPAASKTIEPDTENGDGHSPAIYIVVAAVLVIAAVITIIILLRRRKQ